MKQPAAVVRWVLSVSFLNVACNSIWGIEEASVDPDWDAGADMGAAGSGGSGGSGGVGGSGGSGASGGSGGSAVACGDVLSASETLVRSCVLKVSCDPYVPQYTISDCIGLHTQGATNYDACTLGAKDCDDIRTCTGRGYEPDGTCDGLPDGWTCVGDVALRCDAGNLPFSVDCAALGATCDTSGDEPIPPCKLSSPADCNDEADLWFCDGNRNYTCIDGVPYGEQCSRRQGVCVEDIPGAAYCETILSTCDNRGDVSCDGDAIEVCNTAGFFAVYDCGFSGGTCMTEGSSLGWCLAPGCTPDDQQDERCLDDTTLVVFPQGARTEIDCTALGFAGCVESTHPTLRTPYAFCADF